MDQGYAVGIDLGTSNTVAIVRFPDGRTRPVLFDGQPVLPSAVFLGHDGTLHVGRDAQRMAQLDPARFEPNPKRRIDEDVLLLGDRELAVTDVLAAPLRAIARAVTEAVGHLPPAVLTCPAAWGVTRRARLQEAATRAGWPPVRLLAEPIAAARYFTETLKRPVPPGATLAIFDFGGGTLDVALVRNDGATFTVVGSGGAEDLGGLDIDHAVVEHLGRLVAARHPEVWAQIDRPADELARRHRRAFWDDVRAAKEMLSRTTTAPVPIPGVSGSVHLTRDELEHLALPLLRRATAELTRASQQARLAPHQLSGIFLVGGTSRVPLVSRLLHSETGIAPTVLEQPELPVAEGAVAGSAPAPPQSAPQPGPATAGRGVPVPGPSSPFPVSSLPISSLPVSGQPVSGQPVSGQPFAAAAYGGAAPVGLAPAVRIPAQRGAPPAPGGAPPVPVAQRPLRRRTWPWLLGLALPLVLVAALAVYVLTTRLKPDPPLTAFRTATIADLTPNGFRQAFVAETKVYVIGEHSDGTVEVVTIDQPTGATRAIRSTVTGKWSSVRVVGNWVAVFPEPAADGKRVVVLANGVDNVQRTLELAKGEEIRFIWEDDVNRTVQYLRFSGSAIVPGASGAAGVSNGKAFPVPAGSRLLTDVRSNGNEMAVVDGTGQIWVYDILSRQLGPGLGKLAAGLSPNFFHYHPEDKALYVVEDALEYRIIRADTPMITRGPADRKPLWIGGCGGAKGIVCVIDERPGDPASREVASYSTSERTFRGKAPYAAVPGVFAAGSNPSGAAWVFPRASIGEKNEITETTAIDITGKTQTFDGALFRLNGGNAVVLGNAPAGSFPNWRDLPQRITANSVSLTNADSSPDSEIVVRLATCHADYYTLACAGEGDSFTVWRVKVP